MFLNCGQVRRREDGGVRIEIWEGQDAYEFVITQSDLETLLHNEESVPVGRMFGLLSNPNYGRATLSGSKGSLPRKGVVFRVDCFPGRGFTVARAALEHVISRKWQEAIVSEMIPEMKQTKLLTNYEGFEEGKQ